MSTVERKEYQQTQVFRTVSPVRNTRSTQNLHEFDSNLDNLLEDLQSSVSRPGSSLGNATYKETTKALNGFDSTNRVTHLKASNPVTEYSSDDAYSYTSPDGTKKVHSYKKESYSYKTGDQIRPEKLREDGVNQLDSLLDDLQQVKQHSFEKEAYNNFGIDSDFSEKSKRSAQRELHYGDSPRSGSRTQAYERTFEKEGSLTRDIQYSTTSEGTYGDIRTIRQTSPSPTRSNTSTLTKQKKVTNVHSYPLEVEEVTNPDINAEILAQLDPHLLPTGNTKVTTTIKTYTYEIPGSNVATTEKESYNYLLNESQTTPSKSFVYNKNESAAESAARYSSNKESRRDYEERTYKEYSAAIPPYQKPSSPVQSDRTLIKETVTTRNYQPGYSPELQRREPQGKQAYVYNETTTTRNYNQNDYPDYPSERKTQTLTKQTQTNTDYPPVVYKQETHTTNKYSLGDGYGTREVEVINSSRPPYSGKPQKEPVNISYQYKSQSATTNNYRGQYNEEREPLLHPQPFPKDVEEFEVPKKVDQLMATIGNEPPNSPYNASFTAHEAEVLQQKKIDVLKQQHEAEVQKKEPKDVPRTKNVTGPPVYYPPGHEMFAKKEESGAWRAEGAMAREKAKYEYEAQEKSKSKGRSGAAIVPVCLPLCCGLPCTIL